MAFIEVNGGDVHLYPHIGQLRALQSTARIVAVIAGAQSGKTQTSPCWLMQEMQAKGPGTYAIVTPTFSLLDKSALPKFREFYEDIFKLGRYYGSPSRRFEVSEDGERRLFGHRQEQKTQVIFGYASDSHSMEAVTLKGVVCDEAGQPSFSKETWDNLYTRRLAVHQGRALITTTPYSISGWLHDLCDEAERGEIDAEVIRFDSVMNPAFPMASFEEARRTLPDWRFQMMFRGIFTRPAGQIYDSFIKSPAPVGHLVPRFQIPDHWQRYIGLDFGSVNTAAVHIAQGQDQYQGKYIIYRTYHNGGKTAAGHVAELMKGEPRAPISYGGAGSEDSFRAEYNAAGLRVNKPPISDVEVGITRVWSAFKQNQLLVMDDLAPLLNELGAYSRKVDESGNVLEEIDKKSTFHILDSLRYAISHIKHFDIQNRILRPMGPRAAGGFA